MLSYLFSLIRYSLVGGKSPEKNIEIDWGKLYHICKVHKIESIVCHGIDKMSEKENIPEDILEKFQNAWRLEVARDTIQSVSKKELFNAFEKEKIDFLPLKGCCMKQFYPRSDFRMMVDFDILYRKEQEKQVHDIMLRLGYKCEGIDKEEKDIVYLRKPFMNVEMHHQLIDTGSFASKYYENPWNIAKKKENTNYEYIFSWEDFFVFMIVHLAKHFQGGGIGIRSIVDIWIFERTIGTKVNWDYIEKELEKLNLVIFTEKMRMLTRIWFENELMNNQYDELTQFVVQSGIFGTIENAKNQSVAMKSKNYLGGQIKVWMMAVFLPLGRMKVQYQYLNKFPFLLPLAWIHRGSKSILGNRKKIEKVFTQMTADASEVEKVEKILDYVGLLERTGGVQQSKKMSWF